MIRHRFQVSIHVEDDDQTHPEEFLGAFLNEILQKRFKKDDEEFGNDPPWPSALEVKYVISHYYMAPKMEEINGEREDQASTQK